MWSDGESCAGGDACSPHEPRALSPAPRTLPSLSTAVWKARRTPPSRPQSRCTPLSQGEPRSSPPCRFGMATPIPARSRPRRAIVGRVESSGGEWRASPPARLPQRGESQHQTMGRAAGLGRPASVRKGAAPDSRSGRRRQKRSRSVAVAEQRASRLARAATLAAHIVAGRPGEPRHLLRRSPPGQRRPCSFLSCLVSA